MLIALAFVSAVAELPFLSASRAAIPNLVEGEEDITWANSLITVGVARRHRDRAGASAGCSSP